jgi:hypothetical protein
MIEGRDSTRLQLEALSTNRVARYFREQDLQRDLPAKAGIARAVDLTHSTGTE